MFSATTAAASSEFQSQKRLSTISTASKMALNGSGPLGRSQTNVASPIQLEEVMETDENFREARREGLGNAATVVRPSMDNEYEDDEAARYNRDLQLAMEMSRRDAEAKPQPEDISFYSGLLAEDMQTGPSFGAENGRSYDTAFGGLVPRRTVQQTGLISTLNLARNELDIPREGQRLPDVSFSEEEELEMAIRLSQLNH